MGKAKKYITVLLFILIPMGTYQNCADYMTPEHDGGSINLSLYNETGFRATLHPLLRTYCGSCHGLRQQPLFAVADWGASCNALVIGNLVDLVTPANSEIVLQIASGHKRVAQTVATELQNAITTWAAGVTAP